LQGTERVLEDGIVGAGLQRLPQLAERRSLLPSDAQQVFRGVEVERLVGCAHRCSPKHWVWPRYATEAPAWNLLPAPSATSSRTSQSSPIRLPAQRYTLCSRTCFRMRCMRICFSSDCISRAARIAS